MTKHISTITLCVQGDSIDRDDTCKIRLHLDENNDVAFQYITNSFSKVYRSVAREYRTFHMFYNDNITARHVQMPKKQGGSYEIGDITMHMTRPVRLSYNSIGFIANYVKSYVGTPSHVQEHENFDVYVMFDDVDQQKQEYVNTLWIGEGRQGDVASIIEIVKTAIRCFHNGEFLQP